MENDFDVIEINIDKRSVDK